MFDLKRKLILKGIPENEIKFIHEADNEVKKKELFESIANALRSKQHAVFSIGLKRG